MTVEPGSLLHDALGVELVEVDSFHHQAIDEVAPGLRVTGRAEDGVVEVIEHEDRERYVLGAQFELQEEWRVDEFLAVLDDALRCLGRADATMERIVELRFFLGLDVLRTAELLGIPKRSVERKWSLARDALQRLLP